MLPAIIFSSGANPNEFPTEMIPILLTIFLLFVGGIFLLKKNQPSKINPIILICASATVIWHHLTQSLVILYVILSIIISVYSLIAVVIDR